MADAKTGGTLRLRLTFNKPDEEPVVDVFFDTVGDVFRAAVLQHVSAYRLPCLEAGAIPVVATQEFQFTPTEGRKAFWAELRDESGVGQSKFRTCLKGAEKVPEYPRGALRAQDEGVVFARYKFTAPDAPPEITIIYDDGKQAFARTVREYASNYRLPCLAASDEPVNVFQPFRFQMEGADRSKLKDATVTGFVMAVDPADTLDRRFDFTTMACPFDIQFVLRQPYFENGIGEVEALDPNRREFVDWMKKVRLTFDAKTLRQVIGDSMTISIPCGVLDFGERTFTPKEKP